MHLINAYVLQNKEHIDPQMFLKDAFHLFERETKILLSIHNALKIHTILHIRFKKQLIEESGSLDFQYIDHYVHTSAQNITKALDLDEFYYAIIENIEEKINGFHSNGHFFF